MPTRYLLHHWEETRPALLVEVVEEANAEVVARVKREMFSRGCAHGLVIDSARTLILRDTFSGMNESGIIQEEGFLSSQQLLAGGIGSTLAERVGQWLQGLSVNWHETLPKEEWAGVLLYDVVPAASGSSIERIDTHAA